MTTEALTEHVTKQLHGIMACNLDVAPYMEGAVKRFRDCYRHILSKYQQDCEDISPFNSNVYCHFLYFLSREMYVTDHSGINAEKVYYLNKALNAVDLFYEVELPGIWECEHPLGAVMGRASYGDYFLFYQHCNVGGSLGKDGTLLHPQIGHHVTMYPFSRILGGCHIGDYVIFSSGAGVINGDIPSYSLVFPGSDLRKPVVKSMPKAYFEDAFGRIWHG